MADNIRDIARSLGLSTATVSRVLNNKPDVGEKTRIRVLKYLQKRGYAGQNSPVRDMIGIVGGFSREHFSYYYAEILQGAEPEIYKAGMIPVLLRKENLLSEYNTFGQVPLLNQLKGLIWIMPEFDITCRDMVVDHKLPCVCINSLEDQAEGKGIYGFETDNLTAAGECVNYLWGLGHRAIGFLGMSRRGRTLRVRRDQCRRSLEERKGFREDLFIDDLDQLTPESGADGITRLLLRNPRPTAVIVASDHLVPGVYRGIKKMGYSLPGDVSVIAFDDFVNAANLSPPLTAFRQPMDEMGIRAVRMLLGEGEGDQINRSRIILRMPFMVRESVCHI